MPPSTPEDRSPAAVALAAVARLLASPSDAYLLEDLVTGARECFDCADAVVCLPGPDGIAVATGPRAGAVVEHPLLQQALDGPTPCLRAGVRAAKALTQALLGEHRPGRAVLLGLGHPGHRSAVLVLTGLAPPPLDGIDVAAATAYADAGAAAVARLRAAAEHDRQAARQRALTRAAKQLNASLDLGTVLLRIVDEALEILGGDTSAVYRRTERGTAVVEQALGMSPDAVGWELPHGRGLAGRVVLDGEARIAEDYPAESGLPAGTPMDGVRSGLAVPMRWDGEVRGALTVGFREPRALSADDLEVLGSFAELAASAFANATAHAGLAHAARTDGLTGCLNHASLHQALVLEIERCRRTGGHLALALLDLDHFKDLNERHGHLAGDEALRRAGAALRTATRPYDVTARYGGDEFALVAVGADEATAAEAARRAVERITDALHGLTDTTAATAGVAAWHPRHGVTDLVAAADRALLFGKHEHGRGTVTAASAVPAGFLPDHVAPSAEPAAATAAAPERLDERLRKRTRQLALANALGTRLAALTDRTEIAAVAVRELSSAFGYFSCSLCELRDGVAHPVAMQGEPFRTPERRRWSVPVTEGLIGRCLRTRRPVLVNDVSTDPGFFWDLGEHGEVRSELVVPVFAGDELWGCVNLEEAVVGAFDADDVALIETVAAQVGSALRSVAYYERLEGAYLGTAEALAGALEATDARSADHARAIADRAVGVARDLGLDEAAVRDVRLAALLRDVGEQVLAPVEPLAGVADVVRHERARFDGAGDPDGPSGEAIPLGARIIRACDALHALPPAEARRELRRQAGTQFDPRVVEALIGPERRVSG